MKVRIREGNDFDVVWAITRAGQPEDLSTATNMKLTLVVYGSVIEHSLFTVTDNVLSINIPKEVATIKGDYRLVFEYTLPDAGQPDGDLKCKTDVVPFRIVPFTADADDVYTVNTSSDVLLGFKGDKGDKGDSAYQVWLEEGNTGTEEDYFAYLRQPAVDAGASISELEGEIQVSEGLRVQAESERDSAEVIRIQSESERLAAEIIRQSNEGDRIENEATRVQNEAERISKENIRQSNEVDRIENEGVRVQAEIERVEAEGIRQSNETDRIEAEEVREQAEIERVSAETARVNAEGDATKGRVKAENERVQAEIERAQAFEQMMDEADDKIEEMDTTLSTYDGRVTQVESDISQLAGDVKELGIKDAVQSDKIKDIENVISTMNPNQSAQLNVSGRKTVSLPKNAANGGMSVKLEGLTAENLVVNGDFRNGTTGWVPTRGTLSVLNNELSHVGNSEISGVSIIHKIIPVVAGNVYYVSFSVMISDAASSVYFEQTNGLGIIHVPSPQSGIWMNRSIIVTALNSTSSYATYVATFSDSANNGKILKLRNAKVVNLTTVFGSGNVPDLATCDKIFSDYFEGRKNFISTGRVRSVDASGENPTHLYLTAPELRSNGLVKDEIRKGANGYEHVKRVGVGTSDGEIVTNGDFSTGDNWTITGDASGISDGTLKIVADAGVASDAWQAKTITVGKIYRYSINVLGITGHLYFNIGNKVVKNINTASGIGVYTGFYIPSANGTFIRLIKETSIATNAEFDNISIIEYNPAEGVAMAGGEAVFGSSVHYTLANPVVSPINYGGILNSAENGTVYHEPVIADAGVYGTNMPILMQDYLISAIEEIIKHENGVDTYLNVATAVIAGDGLSFTHPDLASGDLVLFTYAFDKETTNGNITATFYDSNVVKIDTVTGKAYRINEVVTNGVLTRTLTEV